MNEQKQGLDLELDGEVAHGRYANLAVISHSATEFVIDFAAVLPGYPKARVGSRILLSPENAKRLLSTLQENVARYESNFGHIELHQHIPFTRIKHHGEA